MPGIPESLRVVAVRQDGVVTRRQALENGLTRRQLDRLGSPEGRGRRILPRVYALTTGPATRRQQLRAALLYCGDDAQLAGVTCLEVHDFRYVDPDVRVHVLIPHAHRVVAHAALVIRRTRRLPSPHPRGGLPASPVARAAVDACRAMTVQRDAVALLAEAVQRGLCTVQSLAEEVDRAPRAGSAIVRAALHDLSSGVWSAPEKDLLDVLARSSLLPPPRVNHAITVAGQRYVPDACWPDARLIVEVDSIEHHGVGTSAERTARRRTALTSAGWTVLSVSPSRLRHEADAVLREIEAAYLQGVGRQTV